jgi:hypothetical protein
VEDAPPALVTEVVEDAPPAPVTEVVEDGPPAPVTDEPAEPEVTVVGITSATPQVDQAPELRMEDIVVGDLPPIPLKLLVLSFLSGYTHDQREPQVKDPQEAAGVEKDLPMA